MKKFILLIILIGLFSCTENENKEYTLKYVVHYSELVGDTVILKSKEKFFWSSDRGSNYIKKGSITGANYINTSAPIQILEYTSKKLND